MPLNSNVSLMNIFRRLIERWQQLAYDRGHTYGPNPKKRREVIQMLSQRPVLSDEDWHQRFYSETSIPTTFTARVRKVLSTYFGYDLTRAVPGDRLVRDLGLFEATWDDTDRDIFEEFQVTFDADLPRQDDLDKIVTLDDFIRIFWSCSVQCKKTLFKLDGDKEVNKDEG